MRIELAQQGRVVQIKRTALSPDQPSCRKDRGAIHGFSQASRRRLLKLTARLEVKKIKITFVTLTIAKIGSAAEAKAALKRFLMRLRRRNSTTSGIWRMEFQRRGAVHFHLVLFRLPFWKQDDLQRTWTECTGEARSIVDIRLVRSARQLMSYVSKYIAKKQAPAEGASLDTLTYQHADNQTETGRFWGILNQDNLPFAQIIRFAVQNRDVAYYLRTYMGWRTRIKDKWRTLSAFLIADDALQIIIAAFGMDDRADMIAPQNHSPRLAKIFA